MLSTCFSRSHKQRRRTYLKHGVGVRVVVSQIADIVVLFERDREWRSVVGLSTEATSRQWAAHEVVLVVANPRADTVPVRTALHRLRHREHHWTHSCQHSAWWRGSVVRTSVFSWQNFPDVRLIYGWNVTTLWVKCPLWVNQPGQLSLPSLWGQLMISNPCNHMA